MNKGRLYYSMMNICQNDGVPPSSFGVRINQFNVRINEYGDQRKAFL